VAVWDWATLTASGEIALARWQTSESERSRAHTWTSQLGLTPTLRLWSHPGYGWYGEFGVGANYLTPVFQDSDRRFSTKFNFGDHLGLGYRWGKGPSGSGAHELTVRIEHFSNAGIREPNPGMNFFEIRYANDF